jgi:hypothetical protein
VAFIEMTEKDIVRHKLVTRIVEAYARDEQRRRDAKTAEAAAPSADDDAPATEAPAAAVDVKNEPTT